MFKGSLFLTLAIVASAAGVCALGGPEQQSTPASSRSALTAPHESLVIIANTQNPANTLSVAELRRMLLGETTRWPDGRKVTIAMREPGEPERDAMLRLVCRMSDQDFSRYLLHAAYRGESTSSLKLLDT